MHVKKTRPLQRKARSAINDGDRFLNTLNYLKEVFAPHHPEYIPLLEAIGRMVFMAQLSMCDFYKHAWGHKAANDPRKD